jgi:hypothetical protein
MLGRLSFDDLRVGVKGSDDGHGRGKWPVLLQSYLHGRGIFSLNVIVIRHVGCDHGSFEFATIFLKWRKWIEEFELRKWMKTYYDGGISVKRVFRRSFDFLDVIPTFGVSTTVAAAANRIAINQLLLAEKLNVSSCTFQSNNLKGSKIKLLLYLRTTDAFTFLLAILSRPVAIKIKKSI